MDLTKLASTLLSSDSVDGLSSLTGSSGNDVTKVLAKALPTLLSGANDQAKDENTAKSFASALSDHAKDDTSNLSKFLGNVDMADGAKIITHLLGSGEDDTVKDVAKETGVSKSNTTAILSAAAPLLLSLLGQQTEKEDKKEAVGDLVGVLLENVDVGSLLTGLLTDKSSDKKESTKKASSSKTGTKKTSSSKTGAKKSTSKSSSTKKTTTKKASSTKSSTKKTSTKSSTKKASTSTKSTAKKKAASDNSGADLVTGILKSLLK